MNEQQPNDQQFSDDNPEFDTLLAYLKRTRGFDFSGYKRTSLTRRIARRLQTVNVETYTDYVDYLEVHPEEFSRLFDTILINVTNFFRDVSSWDYIASSIIPQIVAGKMADEPIRIWSAGCSSGEEAYTIAILMAEALGAEGFHERVKIYASDLDEEALAQARQATYRSRDINNIPPDLVEKYFEKLDQRYIFRKEFRRAVIFGRHDLVQDAPISRIDLLICRNLLMYFNSQTQTRILSKLHFATNDSGYLFLGKAEMLFSHGNLFQPLDLKRRVFRKVPRVTLRDRLPSVAVSEDGGANNHLYKHVRFREAAFDVNPVAQVLIDLDGFIVVANDRARVLLGNSIVDLKRPLPDLDISYRLPDLRIRMDEILRDRRPILLKENEWTMPSGELRTIEVLLSPLFANGSTLIGISATFTDISPYRRLEEEIEHANQELETAYEELQSTNEELETTNEELQSTVEELETTNEELQSTNEELETMNEELQSANEELQTMNEELRRRSDELNQVNGYLESILKSMHSAVVVVDQDMRVQVWSPKAEELWGLRANEAEGKNFLNLDIGLPVTELRAPIRASLQQESLDNGAILLATNRRGKPIQCRVTYTALLDSDMHTVRGVILMMDDVDGLEMRVDGANGNN
jgi:two-component system CheB/CheR fusion protein